MSTFLQWEPRTVTKKLIIYMVFGQKGLKKFKFTIKSINSSTIKKSIHLKACNLCQSLLTAVCHRQ